MDPMGNQAFSRLTDTMWKSLKHNTRQVRTFVYVSTDSALWYMYLSSNQTCTSVAKSCTCSELLLSSLRQVYISMKMIYNKCLSFFERVGYVINKMGFPLQHAFVRYMGFAKILSLIRWGLYTLLHI